MAISTILPGSDLTRYFGASIDHPLPTFLDLQVQSVERIKASSVAKGWVGRGGALKLELIGIHEGLVNLIDSSGSVATLSRGGHPRGPFEISAPDFDLRRHDLKMGEIGALSADRLTIGSLHVDLEGAEAWDSAIPPGGGIPEAIRSELLGLSGWPSSGLPKWMRAELAQLSADFRTALASGDQVAEVAERLAGLGPGLTPSGDDYLVGAIFGLRLLGSEAMGEFIGLRAAEKTTALSSSFLRAAARGEFAESWHMVSEAAHGAALEHVLKTGAWSGRDALEGLASVAASWKQPSV